MEDVEPSRTFRSKPDVTEVSLVHQLQREKVHLLEMNKHYLSSMSQLEVKLSDFSTLLKLRDKELELLRSSRSVDDTAKAVHALEERIAVLEEENKQLRHTASLSGDVDRLREELAQAIELKTSYESHFREPTLQRLSSEDPSPPEDNLQISESDTILQLQRANQTLHDELESAMKGLEKMRQERDFLRSEVIPVLEQTIKLYELEKNEMEVKMDHMRKMSQEEQTVERPKTTMKHRTDQDRLVQTMLRPKSSLSPKQQAALSHAKAAATTRSAGLRRTATSSNFIYSPSFLRGKKFSAPLHHRSKGKTSPHPIEDKFADEFPDDNELL